MKVTARAIDYVKGKSRAVRDLWIILLGSLVVLVIAIVFDVFDNFVRWYSLQEEPGVIEEVLVVLLLLPVGFALFAYRRWHEIHREITERKRAEEALAENEERFRNLTEFIRGVSIQGYEADGTVVYWNKASEAVYGYTAREALGRKLADLIIPEDLKPVFYECLELAKGVKRSGEFMPPGELVLLHKDGHSVPVYSIHTCAHVKGKEPTFYCIDFDLSERKRIEDELCESERKYRELVEHANSIILHWTRDGRVSFLNEFGQRFFGYSEAEIVGQHVVGTIVPEAESTGRDLKPLMDQICADPKAYENNINENIRRNGERVWIAWTNKVDFDDEGRVKGILSIGADITERRRAEQALADEAVRRQILVEQSRDGIVVLDHNGKVYEANGRYAEMLGYTPEEVRQLHVWDWDARWTREQLKEMVRSVDPSGDHFETLHRRKDGTVFDVDVSTNGAVFSGQKLIFCVCRDITERKRAEAALSEKRRQLEETVLELERAQDVLQLVIESIPARVFWKDKDSRFLGCNSLFARDAGLTHPQELLGKDDFAMKWAEQAEVYRADDRAVMESGLPKMNIVEPQTTPIGSKIWLNTSKVPLRLPSGEIFGVLGVYEDITERRQITEELRTRESYLSAIIENQPGLVWLKNTESRFLSVNHTFARSCGKERPEEVLGKTDLDIWPRELAEKYQSDDREVMTRRTPIDVEEPVFDQGILKWFHTFKTPVFTTDGDVLGTCGFALDVTERKQAEKERLKLEERLQRAEKMEALGTMAGGVAHDLNNVLGIVVGYSELLLDDLDESSSARSEAMKILKGGQRAAAVVQDLLTLARRGVSARKVLNLNNIVRECQNSPEFAKVLSFHPNIEVKTDFEVDLLNVLGSSVHLEKSLINLVSNAAEAMPHGGALAVKTANCYLDKPISGYDEVREGDYVVLSVSDTGEGISASDLKRIFEPFYTKKVMGRSGTGLGLAVVWGTVKDHLGYIDVGSEKGKGTTFTLYFPVTREEIVPEKLSIPAAEYMGSGESILVVDDVNEQRELANKMLEKLHYNVVSVSSGEEAVDYLKHNSVDLVVLDMIMDPGMDGLDTYRKILEFHSHQKAIIVSGFAETERVKEAQSLGAGAYVKKPYVLEKLGLAVRKELDRVT